MKLSGSSLGYTLGIKENAAIFSHPNAWPIVAEAVLGHGDEAVSFYDAILPYNENDSIPR